MTYRIFSYTTPLAFPFWEANPTFPLSPFMHNIGDWQLAAKTPPHSFACRRFNVIPRRKVMPPPKAIDCPTYSSFDPDRKSQDLGPHFVDRDVLSHNASAAQWPGSEAFWPAGAAGLHVPLQLRTFTKLHA